MNYNKYDDSLKQESNSAENLPVQQPLNSQVQQQNPFDSAQYQNMTMPDVPIAYGGGMTDVLLGDNEVPEEIKKKFWFIFNKDNVLTFLDENRKKSKMLNLDITKIDMLNEMPYYDYNFNFEMKWNVLRNAYETKLDRALGAKNNGILNERKALQSQFTENKQVNENMENGPIREGFFRRLLGRR